LCVSLTQQNTPVWRNETLSPPSNTLVAERTISKLTEFSQGKNVLHAAASNIDGFLGEIRVFLQVG
jgi:hypothetical protein